jgi:hypothetical protein
MAYILKLQNSKQWAGGESVIAIQNVKGTQIFVQDIVTSCSIPVISLYLNCNYIMKKIKWQLHHVHLHNSEKTLYSNNECETCAVLGHYLDDTRHTN